MILIFLQRKMDLAEAELESNPDRERDTSRDPEVMIEYSTPLVAPRPAHQDTELPLFSSLSNFKSLPRERAEQLTYARQYAPVLLSEPISPPKQFDSAYSSHAPGPGHGAGLRVQPHSIHGPGPGLGPGLSSRRS